MFYFDCEKTQEAYDKYAEYVYNVFRYKMDDYIKDFSHIFTNKECLKSNGKSEVFDEVYKRPYQKTYMTTTNYKVFDVSGYCDDLVVERIDELNEDNNEETKKVEEKEYSGILNVQYNNKKWKYEAHYYDRLYILTALKKYVGDKNKARELWYSFCEDLKLYDNYTTQKFKNMLDHEWDKIKAETGHISILKKYGFNVDESTLNIFLNEDQYLYDVVKNVLAFCDNGINLLESDTGQGKTESWKMLFRQWNNIIEMVYHKPILIVEPMNSIINSKYDNNEFIKITGNKKFKKIDGFDCYVTNYNHLLKATPDGYVVRDDIEEFFENFEFVIIDESHIMIKDQFRSDVLIPFLMTLNKIKNTKIIIQTATPLYEESVLNVKKKIIVHKPSKINTKIIYRQAPLLTEEGKKKNFDITDVVCLANYYISNGRKTYIYWNNGSLQQMYKLKEFLPANMAIYHKRNAGDSDMDYITESHELFDDNDKNNSIQALTSSVYFGVGNDLNNEVDYAAVIVIGNNIWQEDIQAKGRWRNAKNVEVCIVLLPHDYDVIESSKEKPFNYNERLKYLIRHYTYMYEDKFNKDKSVIINGQTFKIKNREYIDYIAKIQVANEYCTQFCIKNNEFYKRNYDVREEIKPLISNTNWIDEIKTYNKNLKDIRNKKVKEFMSNKYDWDDIRKDSTLEQTARIIRELQYRGLIQYCDLDKFVKSKILRYRTFLKYYKFAKSDKSDYAELFSILWVRDKLNGLCNDELEKKVSLNDETITYKEYIYICGYLMWLLYRNKNDSRELIKAKYYLPFWKTCDDMRKIEDTLIQRIFAENVFNKEYQDFMESFLGRNIEIDINKENENIIDKIIKLDIDEKYMRKALEYMMTYIIAKEKGEVHKIGGKLGSPNKRIKDMNTGKIYNSCKECADDIGHNITYISKYKDRFVKI
jgi:hypothetical protein